MKIFAAGATGAIGRPLKNRCNYDSSGLRLLAVAKYEGLPPWGAIHWVRNLAAPRLCLISGAAPTPAVFLKTQEHAGEFKEF
jgi:hypothetical protein